MQAHFASPTPTYPPPPVANMSFVHVGSFTPPREREVVAVARVVGSFTPPRAAAAAGGPGQPAKRGNPAPGGANKQRVEKANAAFAADVLLEYSQQ